MRTRGAQLLLLLSFFFLHPALLPVAAGAEPLGPSARSTDLAATDHTAAPSSQSRPEGDPAHPRAREELDALPRQRRAGVLGFLGEHQPGADLGLTGRLRLHGARARDTLLLVDGFRVGGELAPWSLIGALEIASFGHGAAFANAPGGVVELLTAPRLARGFESSVETAFESRPLGLPDTNQRVGRWTVMPALRGVLLPRRLWVAAGATIERERGEAPWLDTRLPEPGRVARDNVQAGLTLDAQATRRIRLSALGLFQVGERDPSTLDGRHAPESRPLVSASSALVGLRQRTSFSETLALDLGAALRREVWSSGTRLCPEPGGPECEAAGTRVQTYPTRYQLWSGPSQSVVRTAVEVQGGLSLRARSGPLDHRLRLALRAEASRMRQEEQVPDLEEYRGEAPTRLVRLVDWAALARTGDIVPARSWAGAVGARRMLIGLEDAIGVGRVSVTPGLALAASRASTTDTRLESLAVLPQVDIAWRPFGGDLLELHAGAHRRVDDDLSYAAQHRLPRPTQLSCNYDEERGTFTRECRILDGALSREIQACPLGSENCHPLRMSSSWELFAEAAARPWQRTSFGLGTLHRRMSALPAVRETNWTTLEYWGLLRPTTSEGVFPGRHRNGRDAPVFALSTPPSWHRYSAVMPSVQHAVGRWLHVGVAYTWSHFEQHRAPADREDAFASPAADQHYQRHVLHLSTRIQVRWLSASLLYAIRPAYTIRGDYEATPYSSGFASWRAARGVQPGPGINDLSSDRWRESGVPADSRLDAHVGVPLAAGPLRLEPYVEAFGLLSSRREALVADDSPSFEATRAGFDRIYVRLGLAARY